MKKIILILCFLFINTAIFAQDFSQLCSPNYPKKTLSGNLMSLTGLNFLSKNIIESQIQKIIREETDSKFKIKIKNFYGVNILSGQFNSLEANCKNYSYDGLYFTNLKAQTLCPYNFIEFKDEKIKFKENLIIKYQTEITQEDLDKIISSSNFQKIIEKMNKDKTISSIIQIKSLKATIKKDKIQMKYAIYPLAKNDVLALFNKISKPINLTFSAKLKANNGKLELYNVDISSIKKYIDFIPTIEKLNPLAYDFNLDETNKGKIHLNNAKILDSKIYLDGFIVINKND